MNDILRQGGIFMSEERSEWAILRLETDSVGRLIGAFYHCAEGVEQVLDLSIVRADAALELSEADGELSTSERQSSQAYECSGDEHAGVDGAR